MKKIEPEKLIITVHAVRREFYSAGQHTRYRRHNESISAHNAVARALADTHALTRTHTHFVPHTCMQPMMNE